MTGLYLFCVGVVVLGWASRGCGYSTYPRRYNRDSVWGTCPQHCRCMTLNSRGTRGLLDTWGEEQVSEKTLKYFSGGINDEAARNGRSMVCQGLRTLPDPIPAGKGVTQINTPGQGDWKIFSPQNDTTRLIFFVKKYLLLYDLFLNFGFFFLT